MSPSPWQLRASRRRRRFVVFVAVGLGLMLGGYLSEPPMSLALGLGGYLMIVAS